MIEKLQRKIVETKAIKVALFLFLSFVLFFGPMDGIKVVEAVHYGIERERDIFIFVCYIVLLCVDFISIYQLVQALRGSYMQPFKKWCQEQKNPQKAKQELNHLYNQSKGQFQFRVNDKILMYTGKNSGFVANKDDIIWIYSSASKPYSGEMQPGKECTIHFHYSTSNTENIVVVEEGDEMCKYVMHYLQQNIPDAIFGYSDDMDSIYKTAHGQFKEHVFEK